MGNTVRRQPISFGIPNAPDYKYLNITSFKGMDITDNPLKADYSTASDVLNLYVDENNALTTRPRLEKTNDWFTTITNFESVLHVYKLSDGLLFQIKTTSGVSLYIKKPGSNPESVTITSGITLGQNKMAVLEKDSYIYVMDTNGYYYIDENVLRTVQDSSLVYIPTTQTGTVDSSGVTVYDNEPDNLLSAYYKIDYAWNMNSDPKEALTGNYSVDYKFRKYYRKIFTDIIGTTGVAQVVSIVNVFSNGYYIIASRFANTEYYGKLVTISGDEITVGSEKILVSGASASDTYYFRCSPGGDKILIIKKSGEILSFRVTDFDGSNSWGTSYMNIGSYTLSSFSSKHGSNQNWFHVSDTGNDVFLIFSDSTKVYLYQYTYGASWTSKKLFEKTIQTSDISPDANFKINTDYTKIVVYDNQINTKVYYISDLTDTTPTITTISINNPQINNHYAGDNWVFTNDLMSYYAVHFRNKKVVFGKLNGNSYDEKTTLISDSVLKYDNVFDVVIDDNNDLLMVCGTIYEDYYQSRYKRIKGVCKIHESSNYLLYPVDLLVDRYDSAFLIDQKGNLCVNCNDGYVTFCNVDTSLIYNLSVKFKKSSYESLKDFPNVLRFQNNWWFYGNKNKTWHTANNDPTYIPENAYDYLGVSDDDITDAVLAGQNTAIFFKKDHFYVVSPVTLSDGSVDYPAVEAKGVIGSIATNAAMVSPYKERPLYVGYDGIYSLQQLAYVQSSDHVSVMMSKSIEPRISKEPNLSQALSVGKLYWSIFAVPATKIFMDGSQTPETHCYVFDDRSDSWYYWTLPIDLVAIWLDKNEVYCCAKNGKLYTLKTTDIVNKYNDTVTDYYDDEEQIIEWRWVSQILPMNTINYRKRLINTTFIMTDTDSLDHYGLTYKFRVYRKLANESNPTTISNSMNYVTSVTKKTSISRFNFLQLELSNIPNNLSENKLRIIGLSFKYVLLEMN